jgi:hypothetical protein
MIPEDAPIVKVDGSPVAVQESGELPPAAVKVVLYAILAAPLGSGDVLVIDRGAAMVNGNVLLTF